MFLTARAGTTLAELCIALVLASIAAALGGSVLIAAERHARRDRASAAESQAVRDVAHVLSTELGAARGDAVMLRGDTAIDIGAHVGASVACLAAGTEFVLPSAITSLAQPFSVWRQPIEPADWLLAWDTTGGGGWATARVDSVSSRTDGAGCAADGTFRTVSDSITRRPVTRVRLASPLPAGVARGAPVRVFRDVRWMIYKSGDGAWWLGSRRCVGGSCGAAQPVAGPLAAPRDSGLLFAAGPRGEVQVVVRSPVTDGARPPSRFSLTIRGASRAAP